MAWFADVSFRTLMGAATVFALLFLMAPTVVVLVTSFTNGNTLSFPPENYSLRWYRALAFNSPQLLSAASESLVVALWTTVICVVLGTAGAYAIVRSPSRLAAVLDAIFMSPMVLPSMAFGLALLLVLSVAGVTLSTWTLVAGHTVICTPFVLRMVSASVQELDATLLQASTGLGASGWFTFQHVTFPLIRRGIVAGAFIAFLTSFDHVPVSLMLADPRSETLPIHLWTLLENNLDVRVAAVCGVLVAVTTLVVVAFESMRRQSGNIV
jgi:putative spermidine/putrescine transport system permease protein